MEPIVEHLWIKRVVRPWGPPSPRGLQAEADGGGPHRTHDREILRQQRVVPPGVSERQYLEAERRVFAESAQLGAAVGLRAAGLPVDASGGGARVVAVVRGSGADGRLRPGDVVTAANGQPIRLAADLVAATSSLPAGASVELEVLRRGQPVKVTVRLRRVGQLRRPAIGIEIVTVAPRLQLPFTVRVSVTDVGGPSAGLMVALATYELAGPADVVHGRVIDGPNGIAGEWGHNPLPLPGKNDLPLPACYCGRSGCIETYLCGPGLERARCDLVAQPAGATDQSRPHCPHDRPKDPECRDCVRSVGRPSGLVRAPLAAQSALTACR